MKETDPIDKVAELYEQFRRPGKPLELVTWDPDELQEAIDDLLSILDEEE